MNIRLIKRLQALPSALVSIFVIGTILISAISLGFWKNVLAAPQAETGSITIAINVEPANTYADFVFDLTSPGDPAVMKVWGSQGSQESQFEWSTSGIDVASNGNVFVVDELNHRVQKFDSSGNFLLMWGKGVKGGAGYETCTSGCQAGTPGTANGEFDHPQDIVVGESSNVYVVDSNNHRIQKFNQNGVFVSAWGWGVTNGASEYQTCTSNCQKGLSGSGDGQFSTPKAIAYGNDFIYVVDQGNNRIQYFNTSGEFQEKFGASGTGEVEFSGPNGISVGPSGSVFVADTGNYRIQRLGADGAFERMWGWGVATGKSQLESCSKGCQSGLSGNGEGQFTEPLDVDLDSVGYIYVADAPNTVHKFDETGNLLKKWGGAGSGAGQFDGIAAISLDAANNVHTVDINNHRIQKFVANNFILNDVLSTIDGIPQTITYSQIPVGTYTINELLDAYWWVPPTVSCSTNDSGQPPTIDNTKVTIILSANENVNCGYNNVLEQGEVTIEKQSTPEDGTDFYFLWGDANLPDHYITWGERGSSESQFNNPGGVAADHNGRIFIADSSNNRIQKFENVNERTFLSSWGWGVSNGSSSAQICTSGCQAGSFGSGNGQLNAPQGVAVDSQNHVFVVDSQNHRLQEFDNDGNYISKFGSQGTGEGDFDQPNWVAIDQYDNIYVVDYGNKRVQKFDPDGNFLLTWGWGVTNGASEYQTCTSGCEPGSSGNGDGQFASPQGIAVSDGDQVYVVDSTNARVQIFDIDGNYLGKWGSSGNSTSQFSNPTGIAADKNGDVYVADKGNHRIQKFDATGAFLSTWGTKGNSTLEFYGPHGIAVDDNGFVIISDQNNQRIKEYRVTILTLDDEGATNDDDYVDGSIRFVGITGTYKITEFPLEGEWELKSITCETNDQGESVTVEPPSATINLDNGESVTCEFYNTIYLDLETDFEASPTSGIAPVDVQFTNLSTGKFTGCTWDFGDGATSTDCNDPLHTYTEAGVYTVSLTATNPEIEDTETKDSYITIYGKSVADFSGTPTYGSSPLVVNFTNLSSGDFDTCTWTFGDGETSDQCSDPSHTYDAEGLYTVSLTINGIGGESAITKTDYIEVNNAGIAGFSGTPTTGIAPLQVNFTNSSTGVYDTCTWNFGDGATSNVCSNPSHTYNNSGVYDVSLTVSGSKGDNTLTKTDYITVYAPSQANFSLTPASGVAPLEVSFTNLSTGDYDTCTWDFGDGGTSNSCDNPTHTYSGAGVYTISLTVDGNGGESSLAKTNAVTAYEAVVADFSGSPTADVGSVIVIFTNKSTGDFDTCKWDFGDGTTSDSCGNPSHTYNSTGKYTVKLTVSGNGGEDTETKVDYIAVYESNTADFSASTTKGQLPLNVDFTNLSVGDFSTCTWEFGDGGSSSVCNNPSHTYSTEGLFTVSLTIDGNGGMDTETKVDYIFVFKNYYIFSPMIMHSYTAP